MLCWKKHSSEEQTEQNDKTNVPLQVRSPFYVRKRSMLRKAECGPVSRAFPFISRKQRKSENQRKMKASMTLEAAFTLSLLIFASVSLMLPAKIMITERKMQAGLESAGEELSQFAYLLDSLNEEKQENSSGAGESDKTFCLNAEQAAAPLYARAKVMSYCDTERISHISMRKSSVRKEDEILDLVMDYEISMPFPVLGLSSLHRTIRCRRRCWTGREGRYGERDSDGGEDEQIVYIGKNSTRYHPDRNCHYLSNRLTAVSWEHMAEKRNINGGKYYPCVSCGKEAAKGSTVYIMSSGSRYHSRQDCKSITAYVRAVRRKDVKHLGACSYCGG